MLRVRHHTLAAALIALALVGCRDAAAPNDAERSPSAGAMMSHSSGVAPLVMHRIAPQATDAEINYVPTINPQLNHHYVWLDTSARGNPKLLVFMPGANGRPVSWQLVQKEAARIGYHVIGLMYQNNVPVDSICKGSSDRDCSGDLRLEIFDGRDSSNLTVVTPANGIDNRLVKLLRYLTDQFPDEGWSRFLEQDGTSKWSQIVVAGHSQGGGQAALIGQLRRVNRVVMFSAPPDARVPEEVDPWVFIGVTPADKYFALFHQRDHLVTGIRSNLAALDMEPFGAPVQAEFSEPPYGGTHILFTDLPPQGPGGYDAPRSHQSTTRDDRTPLCPASTLCIDRPDGTPRLRDAWRYLLGEPPRGAP